ncbi:MAG: hypothetical protein ABH983_00795 [Candidatus Micrarchaeota archaeon]|nr:hypothetical protein [Candidatus Micrarchaeota archaeon]
MKLVFAILLSLLMFGCLVKPVGPLESGIKPPPGLDVREIFNKNETINFYINETMMENNSNTTEFEVNETVIPELNITDLDNETIKENETSKHED